MGALSVFALIRLKCATKLQGPDPHRSGGYEAHAAMESHEGPVYVTTPCYILALEGYKVDPGSGQVFYDENLQFLTQSVGETDEPAVVLFTDRQLAEDYLQQMEVELPLLALEIPDNDSLKRFLNLATSAYRIASIDPDPETGSMQAALTIEDMLQNVDFPGVAGL